MGNLHTKNFKIENRFKTEDTVRIIGDVILALGLLATVILSYVGIASYEEAIIKALNWSVIIAAIGVLFVTLVTWSVLRMLSNISTTLKIKN